jgi:uncharacterized membrane protein
LPCRRGTNHALAFDFTPIDAPGASFTLARGINAQGDIVGFYSAGATTPGFLLNAGGFTPIVVPGASFTRRRIHPAPRYQAQGDIVGFYGAGGLTHGFLLDKEGSFTTIDVPNASVTMALGINAQGDIIGQYAAGGSLTASCSRRKAASRPLTSLAHHPHRPWLSILGVTSSATTMPQASIMASWHNGSAGRRPGAASRDDAPIP